MDRSSFICFSVLFTTSFVFLCQAAFLCFSPLCLSPPLDPSHSLHPQDVAVGWLENAWHRTGNPSPCQTTISAHAQADTFTQMHTHTSSSSLLFLQVCSSFFKHLCHFLSFYSYIFLCPSRRFFLLFLLLPLPPHTPPAHPHPLILAWEPHLSFFSGYFAQIIDSTTKCEQCTKEFICPTQALACTGTLNAVRWSNQNTKALSVSSD